VFDLLMVKYVHEKLFNWFTKLVCRPYRQGD